MSKQIESPTPAVPAVFNFESHEVRAIERNGEIWIVAKDVAEILGYKNPREAVRMYCKHAKPLGGENLSSPLSIDPQAMIIPRGDVFRLVSRSKLPTAERFETWLMDEVVPQIFDHGHYMTSAQGTSSLPAIPKDPLELFLMTAEAIKQLSGDITEVKTRTIQAEDMALEASTRVDELQATFRLHEWQKFELKELVNHKVKGLRELAGGLTGTYYSMVWGFVKRHFKVSKYDAIPAIRFEEAKIIITNITAEQLGVAK